MASFFISIAATTPGFIIRKMFEYAKPKEEQLHPHPSVTTSDFDSSSIIEQSNIKMVQHMRHSFYEWMFPLPGYCRDVAWVVLVIWASGACVTAVCTLDISLSEYDACF